MHRNYRGYVIVIPITSSTNAIYLLLIFAIDVFNGISVCSTGYVVGPRIEIIRNRPYPVTIFVAMFSQFPDSSSCSQFTLIYLSFTGLQSTY